MHKKILLLWLILTFSTGSWAQPVENAVPVLYKLAHNMVMSFANTAYFSGLNSNNQNANMSEWTFDTRTAVNIAWASVVQGGVNYYESSYLPEGEKAGTLTENDIKKIKGWINSVGSTVSMITLNTNTTMVAVRYNETKNVVSDYAGIEDETMATVAGGAMFLLRNVGFFYIIPPLTKPINFMFFKILPKANDVSNAVHSRSSIRILSCLTFSGVSIVYQELLISIKNLVNQFLPQPATPLSIARFDDCTRCWFGTNLMGKNGAIGSYLYAGRQRLLAWWKTPLEERKNEEL